MSVWKITMKQTNKVVIFLNFPSTKLVNLSAQHFNIVTCSGESVSARILDLFVNVEILTGRASFVILVSQDLSFFSSHRPLNRKTNIISYHMYLETTADYQSAELSLSLSFT